MHRYIALIVCLPTLCFAQTLPNPKLTPGAVMTTDASVVCHRKTDKVRNVPNSEKAQVRKRYGIASPTAKWCSAKCEIDHLIPLEIGGSNVVTNLWVQPYNRHLTWNAHVKDRLENHLHSLVCRGKVQILQAQHDIASNWVSAYRKYMRVR